MNKELLEKSNKILKLLKAADPQDKICAICNKPFKGVSDKSMEDVGALLAKGIKESDDFCIDCLEGNSLL